MPRFIQKKPPVSGQRSIFISALAFLASGILFASNAYSGNVHIFAGGVSGCGDLADPSNSKFYRADGGGVFIHSVGWEKHTTEAQKEAIIKLWKNHTWGIEMGFSSDSYTTRPRAYKRRYLDRGIQPSFITVNAFSSARVPTVEAWKKTVQGYYEVGVSKDTPICATFEYQNMPQYMRTLEDNLVSKRKDFQEIIAASRGLTLDIPPTVYFRRLNHSNPKVRHYHDWLIDAIQWTMQNGYTVGILISPNTAKEKYDQDTNKFIAMLQARRCLPHFFIVENYSPEDSKTYTNGVGNENTPHHQLGCARMIQRKKLRR